MDEKAFWSHTKINNERICEGVPCLEWTAAINKDTGYGAACWNGVCGYGAHRISFELTKGKVPVGKYVLHKCDNRKCVEPAHLYAGTPKQNTEDMIIRNENVKRRVVASRTNSLLNKIGRLVIRGVLKQEYVLPYSRQRKYQLKMRKQGRCVLCGQARCEDSLCYCKRHREQVSASKKARRRSRMLVERPATLTNNGR